MINFEKFGKDDEFFSMNQKVTEGSLNDENNIIQPEESGELFNKEDYPYVKSEHNDSANYYKEELERLQNLKK